MDGYGKIVHRILFTHVSTTQPIHIHLCKAAVIQCNCFSEYGISLFLAESLVMIRTAWLCGDIHRIFFLHQCHVKKGPVSVSCDSVGLASVHGLLEKKISQ